MQNPEAALRRLRQRAQEVLAKELGLQVAVFTVEVTEEGAFHVTISSIADTAKLLADPDQATIDAQFEALIAADRAASDEEQESEAERRLREMKARFESGGGFL